MKTCPICGAKAVDMASTCFECLYSFIDQSAEACSHKATAQQTDGGDLGEDPAANAEAVAQDLPPQSSLTPKEVSDIFIELWKRGRLRKRFLSHNGSLYVGSAAFNDVEIASSRVAQRALHIFRSGDTIFAEVLSDGCPIFLNGQKLEGVVPLKESDALSFEDVRLVLA